MNTSFHHGLAKALAADLPCGASTRLALLAQYDHKELAESEFEPSNYLHPDDAAVAYLCDSILRKASDLSGYSPEQRRSAALLAFKQSEEGCRKQNAIIRNRAHPDRNPGLDAFLSRLSRKMDQLFGDDVERDDFLQVALSGWKHGTGSTTSITFIEASVEAKLSLPISITRGAARLLLDVSPALEWVNIALDIHHQAYLQCRDLTYTSGDYVTTVRKNSKTDRTICVGPTANIALQLGVMAWMSKCLLKVGIDLRSQLVNQQLAKIGSSAGLVATIDAKQASDSNCTELQREILSPRMFDLLDTIRSKFYLDVDGFSKPYEKFSGMGNGFTFPLETALFWAVGQLALEDHGLSSAKWLCATYGDDMIVPSACATTMIEYLDMIGFKTNHEKTFVSGPFRESCGKHYWNGHDITPVYYKGAEGRAAKPWEIAILAKNLVLWSRRHGGVERLRSTFAFLEREYKAACKPFRTVPRAPFWAPSGFGFPLLDSSKLSPAAGVTQQLYTGFHFVPMYREVVDPALMCRYTLYKTKEKTEFWLNDLKEKELEHQNLLRPDRAGTYKLRKTCVYDTRYWMETQD